MSGTQPPVPRLARRAGIVFAATGIFWILATAIGAEYEFAQRVRALLDLMALAGFGLGLWITWSAWRQHRGE